MFDDYVELFARDYIKGVQAEGLSYEFSDVVGQNQCKKFYKFANKAKGVSVLNEKDIPFRNLSNQEVLNLAKDLVCSTIPGYEEQIEEASKKVLITTGGSYFDGVIITITDTRDNTQKSLIEIPYMDKTISCICLGHEYVHYLINRNCKRQLINDHYQEILPMFFEKLFSQTLETSGIENDMFFKQGIIRTDSIIYHADQLSMIKQLECSNIILSGLKPSENTMINYQKHLSYTMVISYMYANYLYNKYQEDPCKILSLINGIFNGNNNVPDLLNYINANLSNEDVLIQAYDDFDKTKVIKKGSLK